MTTTAAAPAFDWFVENIEDGEMWLNLLRSEAEAADKMISQSYERDLN